VIRELQQQGGDNAQAIAAMMETMLPPEGGKDKGQAKNPL
jgi:hypothetical protein